jgi:copper(I)-binding protein
MRMVDSGGVGSVYFSFVNNDTATAFLEAFSTPYARTASLHESVQEHGVVHMASRERYPVPAGSTLQLAPGGLHVMLDPMVRSVTAGDTLTLRITLANGTQLIVPVVVRALTPP